MTKVGAIWARVSTPGQEEPSLDSQVYRTRMALEAAGYHVPSDLVFRLVWGSMDLFNCPEMNRLRQLVKDGKVQAVAILDRDRLNAKGLQRLLFLTECQEARVELIICQGSPLLEGPEGQIVELALAIGKERSVLRARDGAKDGLHDRALIYRLPTSHHKVYGYSWDGPRRLITDKDWDTRHLICRLGLDGTPTRAIQRKLRERGIFSPQGKEEWPIPTIWGILTNPISGGRYYALRREEVEPSQRRGNTSGKSSSRRLPSDKWEYLPEVEITNPVLTWDEWLMLQKRLEHNKLLAQRNAKADYLLRSFIFCEHHQRRYHGQPHHGSWRYTCPIGKGCPRPYLNGQEIEKWVKTTTENVITQPSWVASRLMEIEGEGSLAELEGKLREELRKLDLKRNANLNREVELEDRSLKGVVHDEVYSRLKSQLRAERQWIEDRREQNQQQLGCLSNQAEAIASLEQLYARVEGRLTTLNNNEWRELFKALNLFIHVEEGRGIEGVELEFGLPFRIERVGEIVLTAPERG